MYMYVQYKRSRWVLGGGVKRGEGFQNRFQGKYLPLENLLEERDSE